MKNAIIIVLLLLVEQLTIMKNWITNIGEAKIKAVFL